MDLFEPMQDVYHYCSIPTFLEMIKNISKKGNDYYITFWASSIYAMNDPSEFNYGYSLLMKSLLPAIEKKIEIKDDNLKLSLLWKQIRNTKSLIEWDHHFLEALYESHQTPFIISFSKQKDFLPMWNAYSDKGKGICLCFSDYDWSYEHNEVQLLNNLHASDVTYNGIDASVEKVISKLYQEHYNRYKDITDMNKRIAEMTKTLATFTITASPYHKHEAYKYEDEARLIKFKDENHEVKYRTSKRGHIIPFIEVSIRLDYLNQVIVGPCCDSIATIRVLRSMLKKYGISRIEASQIPFREY